MPTERPPRLCRDKGRNLAFIRQVGWMVYLGRWGSPEAESAFGKILAD